MEGFLLFCLGAFVAMHYNSLLSVADNYDKKYMPKIWNCTLFKYIKSHEEQILIMTDDNIISNIYNIIDDAPYMSFASNINKKGILNRNYYNFDKDNHDIIKYLKDSNTTKLRIYIKTKGGYYNDSEKIGKILNMYKIDNIKVTIIIIDYAYLFGTYIALFGDEIYMDDFSFLSNIHMNYMTNNKRINRDQINFMLNNTDFNTTIIEKTEYQFIKNLKRGMNITYSEDEINKIIDNLYYHNSIAETTYDIFEAKNIGLKINNINNFQYKDEYESIKQCLA
jgi:hypothetical protein